jgi:ABC-type oligopeptide transport system ATPase subunit
MNGASTGDPGFPLLEVNDLNVRFRSRKGYIRAARGVSFSVARGETLGLIGESGSGKTTVARAVMGLVDPATGSVRFEGREILGLSGRELRRFRGRAHLIFQDPYDSLHPGMRVREIVEEPIKIHGAGDTTQRGKAVLTALEEVGLTPTHRFAERYPHQLSGGQRQRVAIARAVVLNPALVLADEPTSMLDVSLRSEILTILKRHRDRHGAGYLFVTHDLALARHFCDRIAVMYRGILVEMGPAETVVTKPLHPYTRALLEAVKDLSPPDPTGAGPLAEDRYDPSREVEESYAADPRLREVAPGHYVASDVALQTTLLYKPAIKKEE